MACETSTVSLEGIQWDVDPTEYNMLGGTRRGSVHKLVDNTTAFQDRGFFVGDGVIQITGQFTNVETMKSLWNLYAGSGGTPMTFTDFKGNSFEVLFTPGQESFTVKPIPGSNRGFEYSMSLSIVSVNTWFNGSSPY
jgi:hypothetical protein